MKTDMTNTFHLDSANGIFDDTELNTRNIYDGPEYFRVTDKVETFTTFRIEWTPTTEDKAIEFIGIRCKDQGFKMTMYKRNEDGTGRAIITNKIK